MIVPMYFFVEEDESLNGPWVTSEDALEAGKLYGKWLNGEETPQDFSRSIELQTKAFDLAIAMKRVAKDTTYFDPINAELIRILCEHVGERGDSEGAVETLKRIINERDAARDYVKRDQHLLSL